MHAQIHGLTIVFPQLYRKHVPVLCDLLGIPRTHWSRKGRTDSIIYTFTGHDRQRDGKQSAFFSLGQRHIEGHGRKAEAVYKYARLSLHGSFFDNSPAFDVFSFQQKLEEMNILATPTGLDIAYNEPTATGIPLETWLLWSGNDADKYLRGNIIRKGKVSPIPDRGKIIRIEFGSASSTAAYATFYQRDGQNRLEIKYRKTLSDLICYILADRETYHDRAADALVSQLDVCRRDTANTRNPVRHPDYARFLAVEPDSLNIAEIKRAAAAARTTSDDAKMTRAIKTLAGHLNNNIARYGTTSDDLQSLVLQLAALVENPEIKDHLITFTPIDFA